MRILFLTHAFNSLTQRLYVDLAARGHDLSVEFDINDALTSEAVELFRPDLVVAPYLRRPIPESVWRRHVCLVVHPGVAGDRGPSALDWAILEGRTAWGVTVLQAEAEMDAGPVWATVDFPMREAPKSSLYRNEVAEAAVEAVLLAVARFENGFRPPRRGRGTWRPLVKQADRAVDWAADDTATVLRKIRSGDGFPGVLDSIAGRRCRLFDAHEDGSVGGEPGALVGRRLGAVCRATADGAVWITQLKPEADGEEALKLPAAMVLGEGLDGVPELPAPDQGPTWRDIRYEERNGVGYLHFPFYNGAMSADQCRRLEAAYRDACARDTRVVVLMGGADFWCNGIHLGVVEAAASPADESWRNITAMDDLCRAVLTTDDRLTIAAMQGNAGAGGVFLALTADRVVARSGVVLNPHYKNMGNLYGSEYWTYLLPRRVGAAGVERVMGRRLPIGAAQAGALGLVDAVVEGAASDFRARVEEMAEGLAARCDFASLLETKRAARRADEAVKSLERYRAEELECMKLNFYGFDPSYHVARYNFVHKVPHSRTPLYLAKHRRGRGGPGSPFRRGAARGGAAAGGEATGGPD